jgi:hypothetical protein
VNARLALLGKGILLGAVALSAAGLRAVADQSRPPQLESQLDVPPFPAEVSRPFSFGLRAVVADLAMIEAIQVYGGLKGQRTLEAGQPADRQLARLLTYATDLDEQYRGAYRFAGNAMPRTTTDGKAAGVLAAILLLEKGTRARSDDWQLFFQLGFLQSYYLGDSINAARAMHQAARLPGAPGYLGLLASRLAADSGDLEAARKMAEVMVSQATEDATRESAQARLTDIEVEQALRRIELSARQFNQQRGRLPHDLAELLASGLLPGLPPEPRGGEFSLDGQGVAASSTTPRLRVRNRHGTTAGLEVK